MGIYCDIPRVFLGRVASAADVDFSDTCLFGVRYCLNAVIDIDIAAGFKANFGCGFVGVRHIVGLGRYGAVRAVAIYG